MSPFRLVLAIGIACAASALAAAGPAVPTQPQDPRQHFEEAAQAFETCVGCHPAPDLELSTDRAWRNAIPGTT
ncbi:MAG: hypothetical protein DWQ01_07225 [Planctomycetota bacterium]|nr:MAG: hypothetical protein DWQ01_07225 [Planctomycetota bacterium]